MWWLPDAAVDGPRRVIAPAGMPVHATMAGRVTLVDTQAVGAVVIRDADERFHHYRRLQASSITVAVDDNVAGGTLLGVIAPPSDESMPALLYGVRDAEERWVDTDALLLGAADPAELGVTPPQGGTAEPMVPAAHTGVDQTSAAPPPAAVAPATSPPPGEPVRSRLVARRPP